MAFKVVKKNYKHVKDTQIGCECKLDYSSPNRKLLQYLDINEVYTREFVLDDYRNGSCMIFIPKDTPDHVYYNINNALIALGFNKTINYSFVE